MAEAFITVTEAEYVAVHPTHIQEQGPKRPANIFARFFALQLSPEFRHASLIY